MDELSGSNHPISTGRNRRRMLLRPSRKLGECPVAFLAHVASMNGHDNASAFFADIASLASYTKSTPNLQGVLLDLRRLPRSTLEGVFDDNVTEALLCDEFDYSAAAIAASVRYCPSCLAESAHHRLLWNWAWAGICPIHGCWLESSCATCGHRYEPRFAYRHTCKCGAEWSRASPIRVAERVARASRQLLASHAQAAFNPSSTADQALGSFNAGPARVTIHVEAGLRALILAKEVRWPKKSPDSLAIRSVWSSAGEVLEDWPHRYFSCLRSALAVRVFHHWDGVAPALLPIANRQLSAIENDEDAPAFVREAVEQFRSVHAVPPTWKAWSRMRPVYTFKGQDKSGDSIYYARPQEVMKALGMRKAEFDWYVERRIFPVSIDRSGVGGCTRVPMYLVEDAKKLFASTVTLPRLAGWLGCSEELVEGMAREGLLSPILTALPPRFWRFRKAAVERLSEQISLATSWHTRASANEFVSLTALLDLALQRRIGSAVTETLHAASRRSVVLVAKPSGGALGRLFVISAHVAHLALAFPGAAFPSADEVRSHRYYQRMRGRAGTGVQRNIVHSWLFSSASSTQEPGPLLVDDWSPCCAAPIPEHWL